MIDACFSRGVPHKQVETGFFPGLTIYLSFWGWESSVCLRTLEALFFEDLFNIKFQLKIASEMYLMGWRKGRILIFNTHMVIL
jgi:hypothetical protein